MNHQVVVKKKLKKIKTSFCQDMLCGRYRNESVSILVGRAKRALHWGVQSRFRMIYI